MHDDDGSGLDLLQDPVSHFFRIDVRVRVAADIIPLDDVEALIVDHVQCLIGIGPVGQAEQICLVAQQVIHGLLGKQNLLLRFLGSDRTKIFMTPGMVPQLKQRICTELKRFRLVILHPQASQKKGGRGLRFVQDADNLAIIACWFSLSFTKVEGQGDFILVPGAIG